MFSDDSDYPSAEHYRRRGYVIALPIGALACVLAVLLAPSMGAASRLVLYLFAFWLAALAVAFWIRTGAFRVLELALFGSLGLFFLVQLANLFYMTLNRNEPEALVTLSRFGYWLPVFYASSFLVFGARRGRYISVLSYIGLLAISGLYAALELAGGGSAAELSVLVQLHLAGAVLILTFIIFTKLTEVHTGLASAMAYLANTDALTKVNNRRRLERLLHEEIGRAQRYKSSFAVLLLDIDHFKDVNDVHGHHVGDQCLRELASMLHSGVRSVDHVGRWGGEEFMVVVPESGLEDAKTLALRLNASIQTSHFGPVERLTASFGVAGYQPGDSVETLVRRADQALYEAKQAGRNRVATATA